MKLGLFPAKPVRETSLSLNNELVEAAALLLSPFLEQPVFFLTTDFFICPKL